MVNIVETIIVHEEPSRPFPDESRMLRLTRPKIFAALLLSITLASCGGGGGAKHAKSVRIQGHPAVNASDSDPDEGAA